MGHGSAPSGSLDVVDIDRNEHIVAKRQVVLADPVDTALGRIDETVEFAGLERIVGARRASEHAHDLDAVIVAPQHPVWAEIEGLLRRMARSEEHTSELQSLMRNTYAVFCQKKKL